MTLFGERKYRVRLGVSGWVLVALAVGAVPARAQDSIVIGTFRPERPSRAIFGGGRGLASQSLVFTGSIGGGASTTSGPTNVENPSPGRGSLRFGYASGNLDYSLARRRLGVVAGTSSALYRELGGNGDAVSSSSARGQVRVDVTSRTEARVDVSVAHEPLSVLSLEPGTRDGIGPGVTPLDYGLGLGFDSYLQYRAGVGVRQSLSSRAEAEFRYARSYLQYAPEEGNRGRELLGRFRYSLGQGLAARIGYGQEEVVTRSTDDGPREAYTGHRFDAGLEFRRTLSLSRRTALDITSGTVMFSEEGRRRYEVVGNANLRRELGRSWFATVGYDRVVAFLTVFHRPTFEESIGATLSGSLGRRITVTSTAGASRGRIGLDDDANRYSAYRVGSGLTFGLTRRFGLGAHYSYFQYRFDRANELPEVFRQRDVAGHAVRVGLEVFAPIFERSGRR